MYKFKNGDGILVANKDEYEKLLSLLHEQGYEWGTGGSLLNEPSFRWECVTSANLDKVVVCVYNFESRKYITVNNTNVIPFEKIAGEKRFTASEVIKIHHTINEMCCRSGCDTCPIGAHDEESCDEWQEKYPEETVAAIQEYMKQKKSDDIQAAIKLCEENGYANAVEVLKKNVVN